GNDAADLTARNVTLLPDGVRFAALATGRLEKVSLAIPGQFSVYNALAAMSALMALGTDIGQAAEAMSACRGVMGRAEIVPTGRDFTVLIDYAHTPDALENIIKTVRGFAPGRVVVLMGCGGDRDRTKRPIMGGIAAKLADFVIVTSDNPRTEEPGAIIREILAGMEGTETPYTVIENRREAIFWAVRNARSGDVVILAGKGHETYQIVGTEKRHFDEREVVREALEQP
ncbi:MAG: UDP-N-acetylmuramyl-tripeptide synthetase, partial [Oscillospiraceae bacterium]|nr:UDP-N-acetylmuramyl-tripeptide synthetase [Oscillospiraceae bacterium]